MTSESDDALWAAIAEPSRRRVLDLLVRGGEATASTLAADVPFTRQAVIKHLAALEDAGLVTRRRMGREVRFRVDPDALHDATRLVARLARDWDRRLAAIKHLAEAAYRQDTNYQAARTEQ
jgi:DNA-binding transcriptional ArsR family regulator